MKGEKEEKEKINKKINGIINGAQTALVIKDQIGHFVKPLDMFGNSPNLMIGYCNWRELPSSPKFSHSLPF